MRVGLMFPGQGSQRPGMGRPWAERPGWAVVERVAAATGRDVGALLLDADAETLRRTDNAQLATFALELVILAELGVLAEFPGPSLMRPAACAGHSLGECAALVAAAVLSVDDGARLVHARGMAMRAAAATAEPGGMSTVLGLEPGVAEELAAGLRAGGERVWAVNDNAPGNVVLSGAAESVARCAALALDQGAVRVVDLPVGGAFHTPLMAPAVPALSTALSEVAFLPGYAPVVANVDAEPYEGGPSWRDRLLEQVVHPVRWSESVRVLTGRLGADLLVEVGPGRTLIGLAKRIAPRTPRAGVTEPGALPALAERLGVATAC